MICLILQICIGSISIQISVCIGVLGIFIGSGIFQIRFRRAVLGVDYIVLVAVGGKLRRFLFSSHARVYAGSGDICLIICRSVNSLYHRFFIIVLRRPINLVRCPICCRRFVLCIVGILLMTVRFQLRRNFLVGLVSVGSCARFVVLVIRRGIDSLNIISCFHIRPVFIACLL